MRQMQRKREIMTTDNLDLDHLEGLLSEATPGPWWGYRYPDGTPVIASTREGGMDEGPGLFEGFEDGTMADAALIVALVNAAPELIAKAKEADVLAGQVAAMRELHRPVDIGPADVVCGQCSGIPLMKGATKWHRSPWPCPTIQALDSADGGECDE